MSVVWCLWRGLCGDGGGGGVVAASTAELFAKTLSFTMFERSTKDDPSIFFIVNRACPVQSIGLPNATVPFSKRIGIVGQHPFFTFAVCD